MANGATEQRRILHIVASFPPRLGGMEQRTAELAEAQAVLGHDVAVLTGRTPGGPEHEVTAAGVRIERVWVARQDSTVPIIPALLPRLRRNQAGAVWHVHVAHAFVAEQVLLASLRRPGRQRQPFVAQVHIDPEPTTRLGALLGVYKRRLLGPTLRQAAAVVAPTASFATRLTDTYGLRPEQLRVIPPGNRFPASPAPASARAPGVPRILSVGRLAPEKNVELTLRAFHAFVHSPGGSAATLTVVGEGPSRQGLERLASALQLGTSVRFTGRLEGRDLELAYRDADIFVMTSTNESFGCVVPEAMAHQVPVVVPDIDGPRDIVADGVSGIVVDHTVSSVSAAIGRLVADPSLRARLNAGAAAVLPRFDWRSIVEEWDQLYDQLGPSAAQDAASRNAHRARRSSR